MTRRNTKAVVTPLPLRPQPSRSITGMMQRMARSRRAPVSALAEKHRTEWFYRTLEQLWLAALGNKQMTQAFIDRAELLQPKKLKRSDSVGLHMLLFQYARCVHEFGDDRERVLDEIVAWNKREYGTYVDRRTMDNRIARALREVPLESLPDIHWLQQALRDRQQRGATIKKHRKT